MLQSTTITPYACPSCARDGLHRLLSAGHRVDGKAHVGQLRDEQLACGRVVVHHQHPHALEPGQPGGVLHPAVLADAGLQREPEQAALSCNGFDVDLSAHGLDQMLADGQAQPGTAVLARGRVVCLAESLEQPTGLLRRHADP